MRGAVAIVCMLVGLLLFGCNPQNASELSSGVFSAEDAIRQSAMDNFDVTQSAVRCEYRTDPHTGSGGWIIRIDMQSVETTAAIDMAAAGVLATAASIDTSDAPIWLSVGADYLAIPDSAYGWGFLGYEWDALGEGSSRRGTEIMLLHGETSPPGGPQYGGIPRTEHRGSWHDVRAAVLERWSSEGSPEPVIEEGARPFTW